MLKKSDATEAVKAYEQIELIDKMLARVAATSASPWIEIAVSCKMAKTTPGDRVDAFDVCDLDERERAGFITAILEFERKRLITRRNAWVDFLAAHDFAVPPLAPTPPLDKPE